MREEVFLSILGCRLIDYIIKHSSKSRGNDYAARLYNSTQLGGLAGKTPSSLQVLQLCGFSEGMTVGCASFIPAKSVIYILLPPQNEYVTLISSVSALMALNCPSKPVFFMKIAAFLA